MIRAQAKEKMKHPRREREKARQRQEILEAALILFSEKGYHNVTMHEIAGEAEFAIGTLYKFFRNKEDLYRALLLEKANEFHETVRKAMEVPGDEVEKLLNHIRASGEVIRSNAPMIRLYFSELQGEGFDLVAGLEFKLRQQHDELLKALASIFDSGMRTNRFKRIADPYILAAALDGVIRAILFLWMESPEHHPFPEDPDVILNILFKGLMD
jgi:AcrR family transcriptional regulator